MIKDPVTEVNLAVMKIDIKPSGLDSVFSAVKVTPNSSLHILAPNGKAIYAQTPVEPRETEDNKAVQFSSKSDYTGLTVSLQIPHEDLTRDARELTGFVFAISVITVVIALVLSIWGSNILIRPIRHLQFMMRIVREGTLNKRAKVMTYDEIGLLTEDFNRMVDEIERLIHEVYETKLRERDSDLAALQSQINPHFLYNTLETINMMAIRQSNLQISSTVSSLGKLLRYTVDNKEKHVYMREEFRFVDAYLQIQSTRLEGRLQVNWKTLPRFDYCLVPKLFLQPFVENAIEHGLGNHAVLALTISALEEEGHLLISVSDNGVGMSEGQMDELEKRLIARLPSIVERDTFEKPKHGFALRNVHQRISLLYGDGYGVSIDRQAPAGCTFIIRLPKVEEEQNDV
jgi:two-component system sensor histidine kinase YesM